MLNDLRIKTVTNKIYETIYWHDFINFLIQLNRWGKKSFNHKLRKMTLVLYTVFEVVSHTLFHLSLTTC